MADWYCRYFLSVIAVLITWNCSIPCVVYGAMGNAGHFNRAVLSCASICHLYLWVYLQPDSCFDRVIFYIQTIIDVVKGKTINTSVEENELDLSIFKEH